jgi:hypothetical protein
LLRLTLVLCSLSSNSGQPSIKLSSIWRWRTLSVIKLELPTRKVKELYLQWAESGWERYGEIEGELHKELKLKPWEYPLEREVLDVLDKAISKRR